MIEQPIDELIAEAGIEPARCRLMRPAPSHLATPQFVYGKMARRPGAAPDSRSFGGSAAQAGARLLNWQWAIGNPKSAIKVVRLPGVAPGRPPWQGDILLLNHSRVVS